MVTKIIPEQVVPGKRLGRHVEHDPASRAYAVGIVTAPVALKTIHHRNYGGPLDQDKPKPLGSCTGNATATAINTHPLHPRGTKLLTEADAISIYSLATRLDDVPGQYPPRDTGSSGLAAAKAAKQMGLISAYRHAFSIEEALSALQSAAVITGVDWYEGFDEPDVHGRVSISGQVRGGHEFCVVGFQREKNLDDCWVICENSWGPGWGVKGRFNFTVATWRTLLDAQGDVTVLS